MWMCGRNFPLPFLPLLPFFLFEPVAPFLPMFRRVLAVRQQPPRWTS
jgi:hypothetical protein